MNSFRAIIFGMVLFQGSLAHAEQFPAGNTQQPLELLRERKLEKGVRLVNTNYPPRKREAAQKRWEFKLPALATSLWGFSEIAEQTFFAENPDTPSVKGNQIIYASRDDSKRLEIDTDSGNIQFVIDTGKEWRNGCNLSLQENGVDPEFSKGSDWNWPHLLVHQDILDPSAADGKLRLGRYPKLEFTFSAELLCSEKGKPDRCPPGTWGPVEVGNHCLFYVAFVARNNDRDIDKATKNRLSRLIYCLHPVFCSYDGTSHFCHTPWLGGDPAGDACYWTPNHSGLRIGYPADITINVDALVRESVAALNQRLNASLTPKQYSITQVIIGWEIWGAFRGDVQIRDLSLKAYTISDSTFTKRDAW